MATQGGFDPFARPQQPAFQPQQLLPGHLPYQYQPQQPQQQQQQHFPPQQPSFPQQQPLFPPQQQQLLQPQFNPPAQPATLQPTHFDQQSSRSSSSSFQQLSLPAQPPFQTSPFLPQQQQQQQSPLTAPQPFQPQQPRGSYNPQPTSPQPHFQPPPPTPTPTSPTQHLPFQQQQLQQQQQHQRQQQQQQQQRQEDHKAEPKKKCAVAAFEARSAWQVTMAVGELAETIEARGNGWMFVRLEGGLEGCVPIAYLGDPVKKQEQPPQFHHQRVQEEEQKRLSMPKQRQLRACAAFEASEEWQMGLSRGEVVVPVEERGNGWMLVRKKGGREGCVPAAYLMDDLQDEDEEEKEDFERKLEMSRRTGGTKVEKIDMLRLSLAEKPHGEIVARISVRTMLTKKWAPVFYVFEQPTLLLIFRQKDDYMQWLFNPYLSTEERQHLVKKRFEVTRALDVGPLCLKAYNGKPVANFKISQVGDATSTCKLGGEQVQIRELQKTLQMHLREVAHGDFWTR